MSRITLTCFALLLLLFLGNSSENYAAQSKQNTSDAPTGTLQKMIVENGSVTMDLDLNRLNGISSAGGKTQLRCISLQGPILSFPFWFLTICCAGPGRDRWRSDPGRRSNAHRATAICPRRLGASLKRLVSRKTSFGSRIRSCRARRQHGLHLFQY